MYDYDIKNLVSKAALFEQLAEEAVELSHAALKCARILRDENPTPILMEEASINIIEEFSDVISCARILDIDADEGQISFKNERWYLRLHRRSDE